MSAALSCWGHATLPGVADTVPDWYGLVSGGPDGGLSAGGLLPKCLLGGVEVGLGGFQY